MVANDFRHYLLSTDWLPDTIRKAMADASLPGAAPRKGLGSKIPVSVGWRTPLQACAVAAEFEHRGVIDLTPPTRIVHYYARYEGTVLAPAR
jgi:hypothetical protein